jgi:hypothetical protein
MLMLAMAGWTVLFAHPVETGDEVRYGPTVHAIQDAHGMDGNILGNTELRAADDAGDIGAVAVAVVRAVTVADEIDGAGRPPAEIRMRGANAGVDDVGVHTGARLAVAVGAVERQEAPVDAVDTTGRRAGRNGRLQCVAGAELIDFDVVDSGQGAQRLQALRRNLDAKTVERRRVDVQDRAADPRDALPNIAYRLA